jgi:ornithine cyclodeaminase/alanine dehydrogenase-like protein (mu-crystallin family)
VTLYLREAEVKSLLTMDRTLAALESAFNDWAAGKASNQPRRRVVAGSVLATMSAALPSKGLIGLKTYTANRNGARFWVALFDAASGSPRAVLEADWLGRMRTGAASGLATRFLARPDAAILTVIGSGTQALTQVLAVAAVRQLREVRVFSPTAPHRTAFVDRLTGELPSTTQIVNADDLHRAIDGADIITTITSANRPVFPGSWLVAGQHLNVCGSNIADHREVDARAIARADIVVADDTEAARLEAGDLILAERDGLLNWSRVHSLREVVAGSTGARQASDVTLFKSVGLAIEDLAAAVPVIELAEERGVGQRLPD